MNNILIILILLAIIQQVITKGESPTEKFIIRLEKQCEQNECAHLPRGFNENCINYCLSSICFQQTYLPTMLEEGEIDYKRSNQFKMCMKNILRDCQKETKSFEMCRYKLME